MIFHKNGTFATKFNLLTPIFLQHNGVKLENFRLYDQTKFIVRYIQGTRFQVAKINGLENKSFEAIILSSLSQYSKL